MAKFDGWLPYGEDFTREMLRKREQTMGDPLRRREAVQIDSMLEFYLRDSGLMGQWNENRIFQVWDHCSKAAKYTLSKSYVEERSMSPFHPRWFAINCISSWTL